MLLCYAAGSGATSAVEFLLATDDDDFKTSEGTASLEPWRALELENLVLAAQEGGNEEIVQLFKEHLDDARRCQRLRGRGGSIEWQYQTFMLRQNRKFLIEGKAGSGKSTMMRKVAERRARETRTGTCG